MNAADIQRAYTDLGYTLGWTFLLCPEARLDDARIAIVGLNPGGSHAGEGQWDCPEGNVFYTQRWANDERDYSPIQHQIHAWHQCLGLGPNETLLAEFIPFRSPSEATLEHYAQAVAFGRELWRWLLERSAARTFLCMGNRVFKELASLTAARKVGTFPTAWGAQVVELRCDDAGRRIVRMPHPSRYRLFGRADGEKSAIACQSLRAAVRA